MSDTPNAGAAGTQAPAAPAQTSSGLVSSPGTADAMARMDDTEFAEVFGLGEIISPPAAPETPAAAVPQAQPGAKAPAKASPKAEPAAAEKKPTIDAQGRAHDPEDGRFLNAAEANEAAVAAAAEPVAEGAEPATTDDALDPAKAEGEDGEGEQLDEEVAPELQPITEFKLKQAGEDVDFDPSVEITFKANGEERTERLDKVVRLAQMGAYNEEREQRYAQLDERNQRLEPFAREAYTEKKTLEDSLNRILSGDDEYFIQLQQAWQEENSPEATAQRLADENTQLRERLARGDSARAADPGEQLVHTITPRIEKLITAHSEHVSESEIWSQFNRMIAPLKAGDAVRPDRFSDVLGAIERLELWVDTTAGGRKERKEAETKAAEKLAAEKRKLRLTKRATARAAAPTKAAGAPPTRETPKAKLPENPTAEQTIDAALDEAMAEVVGAGR